MTLTATSEVYPPGKFVRGITDRFVTHRRNEEILSGSDELMNYLFHALYNP